MALCLSVACAACIRNTGKLYEATQLCLSVACAACIELQPDPARHGRLCLSVACAACITGECYAQTVREALCLSVACAACIGKYSQNADRTFVDYAVSW